MQARFTFNRVGQGLFYDGKIGGFAFIYDCGSKWKDYVSRAVSDYRTNLGSGKINLVVISHFDDDHISGLDDLLTGSAVDFAVIPYVSPIERLILAVRNPGLAPWLYAFWSDPVSYLIEQMGVPIVVVIGGSSQGPMEESTRDVPPPGDNESPRIATHSFIMRDDQQTIEQIRQNDSNWEKYREDGRLIVKNHNGYLNASDIWRFRFFTHDPSPKDLTDFESCAKSALQMSEDSFWVERVKHIIGEKTKRDSLRKCYKKLFRGKQPMNLTSLVMHHRPTRKKHLRERHISCEWGHLNWQPHACFSFGPARRFGHLLTGDTVLSETWPSIENHFSAELPTSSGILVPHHGSIYNWTEEYSKLPTILPSGSYQLELETSTVIQVVKSLTRSC